MSEEKGSVIHTKPSAVDERTTEVTLTYKHPDRDPYDQLVTYVRTVRVDRLHVIINAIDEAETE